MQEICILFLAMITTENRQTTNNPYKYILNNRIKLKTLNFTLTFRNISNKFVDGFKETDVDYTEISKTIIEMSTEIKLKRGRMIESVRLLQTLRFWPCGV